MNKQEIWKATAQELDALMIQAGVKINRCCYNPDCAKCLVVNCKQKKCPIHTWDEKKRRRKIFKNRG